MKLPEDFILSMWSLFGNDSKQLFEALDSDAPVTIRLNPHKLKRHPLVQTSIVPLPWSGLGLLPKSVQPLPSIHSSMPVTTTYRKPPPCSWNMWYDST